MSRIKAFKSWYETFYEMCAHIEYLRDPTYCPATHSIIKGILNKEGSTGMYKLCAEWTTEFEKLHKNTEWDGEWVFEIEQFIKNKADEDK